MKDKELAKIANEARQEVVRMLEKAESGHTAGALGMADVFTFLYYEHANVDGEQPGWKDRDYVFLSNGHICAIWYVTLANKGYFDKKHLDSFRQTNSLLQGHPHNTEIPGIENSGGPLSQGLSQATGAALALRRDGRPNRVFCLCSDGEHQEGQAWESAMLAGNNRLGNLTCVMDRNNIQIDGPTDEIMDIEPLEDKFRAFKWNVMTIDGHSFKEIRKAFKQADNEQERPTMILANTIPGKGVSEFENDYQWHGKPPNAEQAEKALAELRAEREKLEKGWMPW